MRQFIFETLRDDPELIELRGSRVFQGESLSTRLIDKPYQIYTMGNNTAEDFAEEPTRPTRQFFTVYCHDEGGDYTRVDAMVEATKRALRNKSSKTYKVMTILFLETSSDHDDETLGTILRYVRFQAISEV